MNKNKVKGKDHGRNFVSGVLVLSISTILIKAVGLAYKIPMLSLLGAEGMGYFNSAYEVYALLCIVATTGLPVAISMLVSSEKAKGNEYGVERIFRSAMRMALFFGLLSGAILMLCSSPIASLIGNTGAAECIASIAPALVFSCVSGVYRGYFQGLSRMSPTAVSQLIEVVGKLVFGVSFANFAFHKGMSVSMAAAFAGGGLTLGMILSTVYLAVCKAKESIRKSKAPSPTASNNRFFKVLLTLAVPITLSSVVTGVTRIADMTLILRRLGDIGISSAEANKMYGAYTTMAIPVFGLIPSLITPVSMALIPGISSAIGTGNRELQTELANNSMRITLLLAAPSSVGIAVFSLPILNILFSGQGENAYFTAPLLSVLGVSVLFSCVITTTNAILHSYRKTKIPIMSMAVGCAVKLVSEYLLIGNQEIGILGAPVSTLICDLTAAIINLAFVIKIIPDAKKTIGSFWRIFVSAAAAVSAASIVFEGMKAHLESLLIRMSGAVFCACFVYIIMVFALRALSIKDIEMIPFGDKTIKALRSKLKKKI